MTSSGSVTLGRSSFHLSAVAALLAVALSLSTVACGDETAGGDSSNLGGEGGERGSDDEPNPAEDGARGYFFGPVGAEVSFTVGAEELAASIAPPDDAIVYSSALFQTAEPLDPDATYEVAVQAASEGMLCGPFLGAEGTGAELSEVGAMRIGCEWGFDFVGRSSDDTIQAYSNNSTEMVIGGSARTIGESEPAGDGRFVAFRSGEELVPGAGTDQNIYFRDRLTGQTYLVSHAIDGEPTDGSSEDAAISADGLHVIFRSYATNLVEGDTNELPDIFVWSALDDTVTRVSVGPAGEESDGQNYEPTISGDGSVVAFVTAATTVAPELADNNSTVVVRIDRTTDERTVVSRDGSSDDPVSGSWPMLSEDGGRLVYWSYSDVTGDDNPSLWDMFVYDHDSGEQWMVSRGETGEARNQGDESTSGINRPAISGDGRWVAYPTTSSNLVAGVDDELRHFYLVEVDACDGSGCNVVALDHNGTEAGDIQVWSERASLSYDGSYVTFTTPATNLGFASDEYTNAYVYVRESAELGALTTISDGFGGTYTDAVLSPDGAYVAVGTYHELDPRFATDGVFVAYTGLELAFSWITDPIE